MYKLMQFGFLCIDFYLNKRNKSETELAHASSVPKYLQLAGLGRAEARSQEPNLSFPYPRTVICWLPGAH